MYYTVATSMGFPAKNFKIPQLARVSESAVESTGQALLWRGEITYKETLHQPVSFVIFNSVQQTRASKNC